MSSWGRGLNRPALEPLFPQEAGWPQKQRSGELSSSRALGSGHAPTAPPPSAAGNGPGRAVLGPDAQRPETRLRASKPAVEGRGGPGRPPPSRLAGLGPPTQPDWAHTGGPATWRPGCAPLTGPSRARGLPGSGSALPPRGRLTQKTKLKTKSRYLMHLVQPSTPMAARAAGGLRGACLSWVSGAGPGGLESGWGPGGQLGCADGRRGAGADEGRGGTRTRRAGGLAGMRLTLRSHCALTLSSGARPAPVFIGRRSHAHSLRPEAPPPPLLLERGVDAAPARSLAPREGAHDPPPVARTLRGVRYDSQDAGAWARSARSRTHPWAAGTLNSPKGRAGGLACSQGRLTSPPPSGSWGRS